MNKPSTQPSDNSKKQQKKVKGAPDYDDAAYWNTKFKTGQDVGEWLNTGDVLLDIAITEFDQRYSIGGSTKPRALQLGPGISSLGSRLCEAFLQRGWNADDIVNADFSSEAVRLGLEFEQERANSHLNASHAMQWIQADLCSWKDISELILPCAPFDVILDKSTSDAIATGLPRAFSHSSLYSASSTAALENMVNCDKGSFKDDGGGGVSAASFCPALRDILLTHADDTEGGSVTLLPVEILSIHLAPLARQGALWLVLSYSGVRFDDLPFLSMYWSIRTRTPLKAPSGQPASALAMVPDVYHWVYVLQRK